MNAILCIAWSQRQSAEIRQNALFISEFHIDREPLFVHLFNYMAQDTYCERMPIRKFLIYIRWHLYFSGNMGTALDDIQRTLNTRKSPKCHISDFFEIAEEIDSNHSPILILPPSSVLNV